MFDWVRDFFYGKPVPEGATVEPTGLRRSEKPVKRVLLKHRPCFGKIPEKWNINEPVRAIAKALETRTHTFTVESVETQSQATLRNGCNVTVTDTITGVVFEVRMRHTGNYFVGSTFDWMTDDERQYLIAVGKWVFRDREAERRHQIEKWRHNKERNRFKRMYGESK